MYLILLESFDSKTVVFTKKPPKISLLKMYAGFQNLFNFENLMTLLSIASSICSWNNILNSATGIRPIYNIFHAIFWNLPILITKLVNFQAQYVNWNEFIDETVDDSFHAFDEDDLDTRVGEVVLNLLSWKKNGFDRIVQNFT